MPYINISNSLKSAVVDDEDYDKIRIYHWSVNKKGALQTTINYKVKSMPNIIFNDNNMYDHKNNNMLDNRRRNLRICTYNQNNANRNKIIINGNCSSKYKGVIWSKAKQLWQANIYPNGKQVYLGFFTEEIEAAKAYNVAATKYYGEFAKLNELA